ncbi:MAG: RNA polymerase sigma factor [Phycisphaerae bacterium]|nr:RNA polymerase sigma factor [Phycisphaerae bacterium]
MIAAALNNSGHQLYCPADFASAVLCTKTTLADLILNCFAACSRRDDTAIETDTDIDTTALLDIQDVKDCLKGDNNAYKRIVERHQKKISAMMWRFSRDKVVHEELVQDVFVQVYMSLDTFKQKAPFRHWLYRIATRVGFTYWKQKARLSRTDTLSLEDFDQAKITSNGNEAPNEVAEMLHRLLEKLPPRDRLVLTLRYLQENSIDETAELAGWSTSMVKVQTWRAKKKLKKLFQEFLPQVGE